MECESCKRVWKVTSTSPTFARCRLVPPIPVACVRPPTHALKPEATHENPVVLCEDPEARYATPWPTPPLAPNGPVTCIACLKIIAEQK